MPFGLSNSEFGVLVAGVALLAYAVGIYLGRFRDPRERVPSKDEAMYRFFGTKKKRKKWAVLFGVPTVVVYAWTVHTGQPAFRQFVALMGMVLYLPGVGVALKMQSIFGEDRRIAIRSREYSDNLERDLLVPRDLFKECRLINCNSLDKIWTPQHGETKVALEVDMENRVIMGNWRSIPDARLEGLESDVKRLVEEHVDERIENQKLKRRARELGYEMADVILYRREVGLSDLESPDFETDDEGELLPPHLAAAERLDIPWDEETGDIKLSQMSAEPSKETEESESKFLDVGDLKGMSNGNEEKATTNGATE